VRRLSARGVFDDAERRQGDLSLETQVVAFNGAKGDPHGSAVLPLYQTATFAQPSATAFGSYDYTRSGNPTRDAAQTVLAQVGQKPDGPNPVLLVHRKQTIKFTTFPHFSRPCDCGVLLTWRGAYSTAHALCRRMLYMYIL
jgi:cystathionine beta-lyase/cystathionine gamma-synthase